MKIVLQQYQLSWPQMFLSEKSIIASALQDCVTIIEHFGSTSVAGMDAKPTIDILVGLNENEGLDKTIIPMMNIGYTYIKKFEPQWPSRRFFMKLWPSDLLIPRVIDGGDNYIIGKDFVSLANIHIILKDTNDWTRLIAFRDYLRAHASTRSEYCQLKKQLSGQEFKDMNAYNDAKDNFIKQVEKLAMDWFCSKKQNKNSL